MIFNVTYKVTSVYAYYLMFCFYMKLLHIFISLKEYVSRGFKEEISFPSQSSRD